VWLVIVALAAIQPVLHLGIRYISPEGTVPTGLHIPDSALFLYSMEMFDSDFHSLYATCQSGVGEYSPSLYAVPHLWLYGVLGTIARALHANNFLFYGVANGVGALLYLWAVYRFLCRAFPKIAERAFVLFALSGGPGGLLYLLTGVMGFHDHASFTTYFDRFALYELMEGPHLNPVLYFPRLYYTLSLAICFAAFTVLLKAVHEAPCARLWYWAPLLAIGSFIDARFAVFTLGLVVLYLLLVSDVSEKRRIGLGAWYAGSVAAGCLPAYWLMRMNPTVVENHVVVGNMAMWFSPFVVVAWLHLLLSRASVLASVGRLPKLAAVAALAGLGYLGAYAMLYVGYQLYHGNLLAGRDGSVAANISDLALLGGVVGAVIALLRRRVMEERRAHDWAVVWLIGYLAISLSGFGGGWFLRFGPQRLEVFLWLPLCLFAAMGIMRLASKRAAVAMAVLIVSGVTSISVAALAFQAPFGRTDARGLYAALHPEIMTAADDRLLDKLGEGTVLTTAPMADVVVMQRGNRVVFGIGSFNLTDQPYRALNDIVLTFFDPGTTEDTRRELVRAWCVEYVLCPDTWAIDASTRVQLGETDWLRLVSEDGEGLLFAVDED
jgi:hypothetical protein